MRSRLLFLISTALVACGPSSPKNAIGALGGPCDPDGACQIGLICLDSICQQPVVSADAGPRPDARALPDAARPPDARTMADAAARPDAPPGAPDAPPSHPDAAAAPPDATVFPPDAPVATTGKLSATWSILLNGSAATCANVRGDTVEIVTTPSGGGGGTIDRFRCTDLAGTTGTFAAGNYTVTVRLVDAASQILDSSDLGSVAVTAGMTQALGNQTFSINRVLTGTFSLSWNIVVGTADTLCFDVGASTLEFEATLEGPGATVRATFDCADHLDTTPEFTPGNYDILVRLRDGDRNPLAQRNLGGPFAITAGSNNDLGNVTFFLPEGSGRIGFTWTILQGGLDATCADVGAQTIEIDTTPTANPNMTVDLFDCSTSGGVIDALAPGDYDLTVYLLDSGGQTVSVATPMPTVTVISGQTIDAGDFVFDL